MCLLPSSEMQSLTVSVAGCSLSPWSPKVAEYCGSLSRGRQTSLCAHFLLLLVFTPFT